ncbi:SGNH/GDSL hydrolase family protein [Actinomadura rubrisoli]|uniref:SGNH/GDSL hydrolase family protein n=1 Tax=Actinomadura rubrisoli TaxID=2530368 RepID=A0A4V2YSV5_9ACTN|nr:SGNH/GDSL hydrolase family protein [Actinomadura rubrisoli]TDD71417.1 SGNH/GDSL hydrolase family protein [Actinomadura rubrisoli]
MGGRPGAGAGRPMVVLGDSVAEGQDDPDPAGGWLGWAGRLARHLDIPRDRLVNLSTPGATIEDVVRDQLPAAREPTPELVMLGCGMNDALNGFERARVADRLAEVFGWARAAGAVAIAIPVPRPPFLERSPMSQFRRKRVVQRIADFNEELDRVSQEFGMTFPARESVSKVADPSMWSADGIHLNVAGHAYVAEVIAHIARSLLGERAS